MGSALTGGDDAGSASAEGTWTGHQPAERGTPSFDGTAGDSLHPPFRHAIDDPAGPVTGRGDAAKRNFPALAGLIWLRRAGTNDLRRTKASLLDAFKAPVASPRGGLSFCGIAAAIWQGRQLFKPSFCNLGRHTLPLRGRPIAAKRNLRAICGASGEPHNPKGDG